MLVLGVAAACGGGSKVGKQTALSPECRAVLSAFTQRDHAMSQEINRARQVRLAFTQLISRGAQGASTSELGTLSGRLNAAMKNLAKAEQTATRASNTYAARRAKCTLTGAPAACRKTFQLMQSLDTLDTKKGIPIVKKTDAVIGAFSLLVKTYGANLLSNAEQRKTVIGLVDRSTKVAKDNNAYVKKSNALVKQYDTALERCTAALSP